MALLAATTLGAGSFASLRAEVSSADAPDVGDVAAGYRLVVQSYDSRQVASGGLPGESARPLASTQRAITAEELQRGVSIDVLHVGTEGLSDVSPVVVAWVEAGRPDLEFDALTARPAPGALFGMCRARGKLGLRSTRVVLTRRLNAAA